MGETFPVPGGWLEMSRQVERFVRRFFRGRCEIDPADVTQDVLLQLLRRARVAPPEEDLASLALVVARRRCIDALRRSYIGKRLSMESGVSLDGIASGDFPADVRLARNEVRALLLRMRELLTPRCRAVLDQLLLGLRLAEIAQALGVSAGAVRNRWFHCRQQIREILARWGIHRQELVDS